jgi:hypothetical protein
MAQRSYQSSWKSVYWLKSWNWKELTAWYSHKPSFSAYESKAGYKCLAMYSYCSILSYRTNATWLRNYYDKRLLLSLLLFHVQIMVARTAFWVLWMKVVPNDTFYLHILIKSIYPITTQSTMMSIKLALSVKLERCRMLLKLALAT